MKTPILLALLIAAPVFAQDWPGDDSDAPPPPPEEEMQYQAPEQGPTFDDFHNNSELSYNGEWLDTPEYGMVWRPTNVDSDWRPYEYGHWTWTNAGWAWVSEEPFGWAVYHYGRWAVSPAGYWLWVPGRVWAPAWVSWRWGDGYAGWCPLGPQHYVYSQPQRWVYVQNRHFLEPIRRHVVPHREVPHVAGAMTAPSRSVVERATGHSVRPVAIHDLNSPSSARGGGGVGFYRPRSAPVAPHGQPHAQPGHPTYYGGVPGPRYGGQPRPAPHGGGTQGHPQPNPTPAPKPAAKPAATPVPHAKEK